VAGPSTCSTEYPLTATTCWAWPWSWPAPPTPSQLAPIRYVWSSATTEEVSPRVVTPCCMWTAPWWGRPVRRPASPCCFRPRWIGCHLSTRGGACHGDRQSGYSDQLLVGSGDHGSHAGGSRRPFRPARLGDRGRHGLQRRPSQRPGGTSGSGDLPRYRGLLCSAGETCLAAGGYSCRVVVGDGREGWPSGAPYDRIIVTAASDRVPRAWRDQLLEDGLVQLPLRLTNAVLPQVVATFRRDGDLLRSVAILSGSFMVLRDGAGADSPADLDPTLRAMIRTKSSSREFLSLDGEALSRLSAGAGRRLLTLLLGEHRRLRTLPTEPALGLVTFLQLSGIPNLVRCTFGTRYGVALVGPRAANVTAITRAPGQPGRIETWGEGRAEELLSKYVKLWVQLGSPTLRELQLTARFGPKSRATRSAWRHLHGADSIVQIDWN